jgi:hypothetical protein
MKKRGHIILGAIISFLFIYLTLYLGFSWFVFSWKSLAIISAIVVFYSILPDVDHKGSTITWWFFGAGILGLIVGIVQLYFKVNRPNPIVVLVFSTALLVFTFISGNFLKHRGLVHTVQVGLVAAFPVYFFFHSVFYASLAYVVWHSHLIGDGYFFKIRS